MDKRRMPNTRYNYLFNDLLNQYVKHGRLIIAYDFDDTVHPTNCRDCNYVQSVIRAAREVLNAYFIVFTCNTDTNYIINYLNKNNIPFDTINKNCPLVPEWVTSTNKIYYNLLLDDKAGLKQAVEALDDLIYVVENNKTGEYI